MNAGAYGGELKDVVRGVLAISPDGREERVFTNEEMQFGYRHSVLSDNGYIALFASLQLAQGDPAAIALTMRELNQKRNSKQPVQYPSAGSTFKRPEGHFAGKLIEDCGLRGFTVGGAQISEKHCGFVINRGGATCADVVALTEQVRQIVEARTGFVLEREIRVVK